LASQRILITGISGLLAPWLVAAAEHRGIVITTGRSAGDIPCDLSDPAAVGRLISQAKPDVVIHAAAMTDVDSCEREPEQADIANRKVTEHLCAALKQDATFLYLSTDQVYADVAGPHREEDVGPVNSYGASKLAGERAALEHRDGIVARTSFFGPSRTPGRASLSDFVVDSLSSRREITLFSDVLFTPLHAITLADLLFEMVQSELRGSYNVATREGLSKADFALEIARRADLQTGSATLGVSSAVEGRAKRTIDLRMAPEKLEIALARTMPTLREEIAKL